MTNGENEEVQAIELPSTGVDAFSALMDFLVEEPGNEEAVEGGDQALAPGAGEGQATAPLQGAPATPGAAGTPPAGAPGQPPVQTQPAPGESVGFDATALDSNWGDVLSGLESRTNEELEFIALEDVKSEFASYVNAVNTPPRMLVGTKVPKLGGAPGEEETLRDSRDAAEWQETVKVQLAAEVKSRASRSRDEVAPMLETLHSSVELLRGNPDLIPGSRQFSLPLLTEFLQLAQPYEMRVEGKLTGYTIPVQPLVDQIRTRITSAAAAAPPPAPVNRAANQPRAQNGTWTAPEDGPQAGILSQAGSSGGDDPNDMSVLWGTLGLPSTFRV